MWTGIWFMTNIVFVVCVIAYLFAHRSVSEAKHTKAEVSKIQSLILRRKVLGIASLVMFLVMAGSFMMNMKVNG
ncbi:hypothetical protein [Paenibacillus kobensis]|uniref:hypothetical protein n=1 Tax=Paenibacillus kobensis TaxID=59841 RepID=UPI000FD70FF5|nr:hypothetical protein [Paenibacillus kobensis]